MKKLLISIFSFCFLLNISTQSQTYTAKLMNSAYTAVNAYEFDIYIKSADTAGFNLYQFQIGLTVPEKTRNGGTLSGIYLTGTCELPVSYIPSHPSMVIAITVSGSPVGGVPVGDKVIMFMLAGRYVAGSSALIPNTGNGLRLGRFRITTTNTAGFAKPVGVIAWQFNSTAPFYKTMVRALVNGIDVDVTNPDSHTSELNIQLPTSKDENRAAKYAVEQNYPNPFNPSTTINYELQSPGRTTLKIFNVLGWEVARLVDDEKNAGKYSAVFNAGALPSGVYFCELKSGGFRIVRKMCLLK